MATSPRYNRYASFTYNVPRGRFSVYDHEDVGSTIAYGYSGKAQWLNDPDAEREVAKGPIPRGVWRIRPAVHHHRLGRYSLPLEPVDVPSIARSGRSGFYIHGDNRRQNLSASSGCIILPRGIRQFVSAMIGAKNGVLVVEANEPSK